MLSFKMISNNPEKRFWDWFIENEKYIYENLENPKEQEKIFDKMSQLLSKIDENLVFEFSPIKENGINGVCNEDLILMVLTRLQSFQESEYSCRENACAITKLEEALLWLRKRTQDREVRGVEGTHKI